MAQLVRAPPCHGGGRGFEPHPGRINYILFVTRDLSSAGRASALQAEGHRFEPYRSHCIVIFADFTIQVCTIMVVKRYLDTRPIVFAGVAELADALDLKSNGK